MTRDFWSDARRFLRGKTYVNFSGVLEEGEDAVGQSYGENHERLARIKARYDPDNVSGLTRTSARALSGVAAGGKPTVIGRSAALALNRPTF